MMDSLLERKVVLQSWKGDYLHRPDGDPRVITFNETGIGNEWTIIPGPNSTVRLLSWKGDFLHRPESGTGVTTFSQDGIGNNWTLKQLADSKYILQSWRGDYLHRPDSGAGVTTFNDGGIGNEWCITVVAKYRDSNWMEDNLQHIGDRRLNEICIPGSHDAGMSTFGKHTLGAQAGNTKTQTKDLLSQLKLGARYFDIRPVISGGDYYTGHYTKALGVTWQGANGQSIASIINDINDFTADRKELIILDLSHDLNTDVGNLSYRQFNLAEWNELFSIFENLNCKFTHEDRKKETFDLTTVTLNEYISQNSSVIAILPEDFKKDFPDTVLPAGFYHRCNFPAAGSYANKNNFDAMKGDQISKLRKRKLIGELVRLRSWKGDFLHRPDSEKGVTTFNQGGAGNLWIVETLPDESVRLISFKGDFLHRPESGNEATTFCYDGPGDNWTLTRTNDTSATLRSFKGDYLHRPDGDPRVILFDKGGIGNEWKIEIVGDNSKAYFHMSWTLTQNDIQAAAGIPTILNMAEEANNEIEQIFHYCKGEIYPNIISIDRFEDARLTNLVVRINNNAPESPLTS